MSEEAYDEALERLVVARNKVAEAIQEYLNAKVEVSCASEDSDHYGQAPHGHILSDAVVCYQSICLHREDGKPGYQINYMTATDGTYAADFGVVNVVRDMMVADYVSD